MIDEVLIVCTMFVCRQPTTIHVNASGQTLLNKHDYTKKFYHTFLLSSITSPISPPTNGLHRYIIIPTRVTRQYVYGKKLSISHIQSHLKVEPVVLAANKIVPGGNSSM